MLHILILNNDLPQIGINILLGFLDCLQQVNHFFRYLIVSCVEAPPLKPEIRGDIVYGSRLSLDRTVLQINYFRIEQ